MGRPRTPQAHRAPLFVLVAALAVVAHAGCARCLDGSTSDPDAGDATPPTADASPDATVPDGGLAPDGGDCLGTPAPAPQGDLSADAWQSVQLAACQTGGHVAAAAAGQTLRLRVRGATAPLQITVRNDHDEILASDTVPAGATTAELPITVDDTGGLQSTVQPSDSTAPASYEIRLDCETGCDLEATRYPIVLVHGAGGATFFGTTEYFYGIVEDLQSLGYPVYTPTLSAWAHSSVRAAELASAIDDILVETGARRVHLLGHSQAGLDFRVLLSPQGLAYADRVATATSLSTPHAGLHPAYASMSSYFGMDVTESYITGEFAQTYPEDPGVLRFSWAAATCGAYETTCLDTYDDEVVAAGLASSYLNLRNLYGTDGHGGDNDGVVPVSSASWGTLLGVLPADHWDLVGQIPGQRLGSFDTLAFFRSEARRLRQLEIDQSL